MNTQRTSQIIMGIDPGSQVTGVGVIEAQGQNLKHVYSESVRLPKGELAGRLQQIYRRVKEIIEQTDPEVVAIEKVFIAKNPQSALVLGHARGAAMLAAINSDVPVVEYSATEIKKTIVGKGRADKAQVQHMIRVLLGLRQAPAEDASDALAGAICHSHHQSLQRAVNQTQALQRGTL